MSDLHQVTQDRDRLRKRVDEQAKEIKRLRTANSELETLVRDLRATKGNFTPRYVTAISLLSHIAYSSTARPGVDTAGPVTGTVSKSQPPRHDSTAYAHLKREWAHQAYRAERIEGWIINHVDPKTDPGQMRKQDQEDPFGHVEARKAPGRHSGEAA